MDYRLGAARKLYASHTHPRIFLGPADLDTLRRRCRRGDGAKLLAVLREKTALIAAIVHDATDLPKLLSEWNINWHQPGTRLVFGLNDLAMVGLLDRDERRLEAVRRVLAACPAAAAQSREGVRRLGYAAGDHLCLAYDLVHAHLTDAERRAFCAWARRACLTDVMALIPPAGYYKSAGGNIKLGGMLTMLHALLALDGEPGVGSLHEEWHHALLMYQASLHVALGADGYPEEDVGYGTSVGGALVTMGEALCRAGVCDVPRDCPRYLRFGQAILHFVQPWGADLSNTGDHGDDFGGREFPLARLAARTRNPALLWLLGTLSYDHGRIHPENSQPEFYREVRLRRGFQAPATQWSLLVADQFRAARPPAAGALPTAFCDRTRGIVSLRSGWGANDTFVVFDGSQRSPAAQGHAHASGGHFSLSALGEYFAIDTGRYNNEQNCHNVTLINGQSGRSTNGEWMAVKHAARLSHYAPGPFVDAAAVDTTAQHNCFWARRTLGLVKGRQMPPWVWVVDDLNACDDWAEYHWQLQTSPENRIELHGDWATIHGWRQDNVLDVHFILPAPEEYPKPHRLVSVTADEATPSAHKYVPNARERVADYVRPAAMVHGPVYVRPRLTARIEGYNGRFLALLLPRRADTPPATVERLASLPASLAVRISQPRVVDTLIFAYEHQMLHAADVRGRGRWCVVREDRRSGRVLAHALGEGVCLEVDDRVIERASAR